MTGDLARMLQLPVQRGVVAGMKLQPLVQPTDWKRVLAGTLFIFLAIAGRVWHFWAGEILRFILMIGGIILLVEGMKNDLKFIHGKMHVTALDQGKAYFVSGRGLLFRTQYLFQDIPQLAAAGPNSFDTHAVIQPKKLTVWDHAVFTAIALAIGMQSNGILLFPANLSDVLATPATTMTVLVLAVLVLVFLAPTKVFKVKLGDRNYQIPVMAREPGQNWLFCFETFFKKYASVFETHGLQLVLRIVEILVAFILGAIFSAYLLMS